MIDLHSHVLPGLDDGAVDEATALAMCRIAAEDGIRTLVATPHFGGLWSIRDAGRIEAATDALRRRLAEEAIPLDLRFAAEMPLSEEMLDWYSSGACPTYDAGRRYVLFEMAALPDGLRILGESIFRLRMAGATPLLAHPERLSMLDDPADVERLLAQGALLQVTATCLLGPDCGAKRRAVEWLRRGWVHVVSTDTHDPLRRPPRLSMARVWLEENFGAAVADALVRGNPQKILDGEDV
jgi:protein-tyrosine phosphatase